MGREGFNTYLLLKVLVFLAGHLKTILALDEA